MLICIYLKIVYTHLYIILKKYLILLLYLHLLVLLLIWNLIHKIILNEMKGPALCFIIYIMYQI